MSDKQQSRATLSRNFVAQQSCRQLSVFHRQTIAKQASFLLRRRYYQ